MTAFGRGQTTPARNLLNRVQIFPIVSRASEHRGAREGGELVFAAQAERRAKNAHRKAKQLTKL